VLRKTEQAVGRELKAVKYDKLLMEKQLEEVYRKKLPR
jgi:hypothetical protein